MKTTTNAQVLSRYTSPKNGKTYLELAFQDGSRTNAEDVQNVFAQVPVMTLVGAELDIQLGMFGKQNTVKIASGKLGKVI